jgi:tRNA modification GTPase
VKADTLRIGTKIDLLDEGPQRQTSSYDALISTATGEGIDALLELVTGRAAAAVGDIGDILPSRQRHISLLSKTTEFLESSLSLPDDQLELRSENLRLASDRLGRISGAVDPEDLLDVIFSQFCIGK